MRRLSRTCCTWPLWTSTTSGSASGSKRSDDVGERPARVQARRRFRETEHARDDRFELVEFFADHAHVGAARIALRKIDAEATVEQFQNGERVANFMRDLGGEQAEGGEAFVFAEHVLALEHARVEAGVFERDGAEARERGAEAFFVVVETAKAVGENREHAEDFVVEDQRRREQ